MIHSDIYTSVHLLIRLPVHTPSIHLSTSPSTHPPIQPFIHPSTQPPIHPPTIHQSTYPFIYPLIHSTICLSIHPPTCLSIYVSANPPIHLPTHSLLCSYIYSSTFLVGRPSANMRIKNNCTDFTNSNEMMYTKLIVCMSRALMALVTVSESLPLEF